MKNHDNIIKPEVDKTIPIRGVTSIDNKLQGLFLFRRLWQCGANKSPCPILLVEMALLQSLSVFSTIFMPVALNICNVVQCLNYY